MDAERRENEVCVGIIPARYSSTRFPGKPLALIKGKPMFWHVWNRARQCARLERVLLATDDARIRDAASELGVEAVMTRSDHASGTDRVYEAATILDLPDYAIVANIQGDEPALAPLMLDELLEPFRDASVLVSTLARHVPPDAAGNELDNADRVKVVLDAKGNALYFSRAKVPYMAAPDAPHPGYYLHVGLYAYRMQALRRFTQLPPGSLERAEKLEQLRLLENGVPIRVGLTRHRSHGVDRPEDIALVSSILTER